MLHAVRRRRRRDHARNTERALTLSDALSRRPMLMLMLDSTRLPCPPARRRARPWQSPERGLPETESALPTWPHNGAGYRSALATPCKRLPIVRPMRSWLAIWVLLLSCVFVTQTAAASVAPYNPCCLQDCRDEMGQCVVSCTLCGQVANLADATPHPRTSDTPRTVVHDTPVLPFPAYALWMPPE